MIIRATEQEEREYLDQIKQRLESALHQVDLSINQYSKEFRQNEQYTYDQRSGMDDADIVSAGQSVIRMISHGESVVVRKRKLVKLMESPYFGRIDFTREGANGLPIYIGVHSFSDGTRGVNLIYDWRAPVSSMFYDFELGPAWYNTPGGIVSGTIELRRQYRIRKGAMEWMLENELNIHDDVLQKELSKSADDKMKNIVATIQRDQNAVIRNETSRVLIIQGVAGSGKTSIALHRIAFLLYRFRDSIAAKDILIISPNKVFADYISNVLPELGEEQIPELGMDELAEDLLEGKFKFQTFFQQVVALLDKHDDAFIERIRFKSSPDFLRQLNRYMVHLENNLFVTADIPVAGMRVPASFLMERFRALQRIPLLDRFPEIIKDVQQYVRTAVNRKLTGQEKTRIYQLLSQMLRKSNLLDLYRDFYKWLGRPEFFRMDGNVLEYSDVFPLIYCKIRLEGVRTYQHVKHLVVDEMQDYTPVQYHVLSRVFSCKKTILGDANQSVNPYSASSAEDIHDIFPQADLVKLFRSYRSTFEITHFTLGIRSNPDLIALERHGPVPEVKGFDQPSGELDEIKLGLDRFRNSGRLSLGIICKTQGQADSLNSKLGSKDISLLTADSTSFKEGIVITTVHLAKGLEFDEVIIPYASADNYKTDIDQSMLYIACTRAMHQLTLTFTRDKSRFLPT